MPVVKPAPRVVSRLVEGQAILLDTTQDRLERLNAVGTFIWARIKEKRHDLDEIYAALLDEFDVEPAQARVDFDAFIAALTARAMIRTQD
ncbi:MAG: hypothetical protein ACI9U2_000459 [Bradymonadia bacterium]